MSDDEQHSSPHIFVQTAYQVADAQQAALQWSAEFGAGPFFLFEHIPLQEVRFRGHEAALDHSSAYGWLGEEMIELVQQNCDQPSVFSGRPPGVHHRARFVRSLDEECLRLASFGDPTAMTATTATGLRFAFIDSRARLGHYQELYEDDPGLRSFYRQIRRAASGWQGDQPLRRLDQL